MEKDLFHILQVLKIYINLDKINYNHMTKENYISELRDAQIVHNSFCDELNKLNRKYYLLCIITLGIYRKKYKKYYIEEKEQLLDDMVITNSIFAQIQDEIINYYDNKEKLQIKINTYKNNFKQIDNFLNFCEILDTNKKDKYLNYKIGEKYE